MRRLEGFKKSVRKALVTDHVFTVHAALPPGAFAFHTDPEKVEAFMEWLQQEMDANILEVSRGRPRAFSGDARWSDLYIRSAYGRGIVTANDEMRKAGILPPGVEVDIADRLGMAFHMDRVGLLYIRTYEELRGVTGDMARDIADILAEGMGLGEHPRTMARDIYRTVDGIGKYRANLIARTEVMRAHHLASVNEYRSAGVEGVKVKAEWLTAGDERVCPICAEMEGRVFTLDEIEPMIPAHPLCVASDTKVLAPGALSGFVTTYTGTIVEASFSNGSRLTTTPKHMLATPNGFVRVENLREGSDVLCCPEFQRVLASNPEYDWNKLRIDNIVKAFAETSGRSTVRVPVSPEDFHGDGEFCKGKVNIVWANRFLVGDAETEGVKKAPQDSFDACGWGPFGDCLGDFTSRFGALVGATDSSMGRFRDFFAFVFSHFLHSDGVGLASTSDWQVKFFQSASNDTPCNIEALRHAQDALTRLVKPYQLNHGKAMAVSCWRDPGFHKSFVDCLTITAKLVSDLVDANPGFVEVGNVVKLRGVYVTDLPVYDLQTMDTVYIANGIYSSNCRCVAIPYLKGLN